MNNSQFTNMYPYLWRKIDILCHGIKEDCSGLLLKYYSAQNPHETKRTGNAGLQIKLGPARLPLNVAVFKRFCEKSPYVLVEQSKKLFIVDERDNTFWDICCPSSAPFWYEERIPGTEQMVVGDYVLLEGDFTAIASITRGCDYFMSQGPCHFCAIGAETQSFAIRKPYLIHSIRSVCEDLSITNFHLTGGNTLEPDRGIIRYLDYVKLIKEIRNDMKIAVEFTPPEISEQRAIFECLKHAGVDSITMNIEFWNDEVRAEFMPIKGVIPKQDYFNAFDEGLTIFGNNKVTCGFIVGLESIEDTKRGIEEVVKKGVVAEVYPFKPNTGSILENREITDTSIILEASLYADCCMKEHNVKPNECSGCVKCGACGLTQHLIDI